MLLLDQERALVGAARLDNQVQAAEERLRQAEQATPPYQTPPSEFAKQHSEFAKHQAAPTSREEAALPLVETTSAGERQAR